jgi:hypothetical protein
MSQCVSAFRLIAMCTYDVIVFIVPMGNTSTPCLLRCGDLALVRRRGCVRKRKGTEECQSIHDFFFKFNDRLQPFFAVLEAYFNASP